MTIRGVIIDHAHGLHEGVHYYRPQKLNPRFFISFEITSLSDVLAGTSLDFLHLFWMGLPSTKSHK